VLEAAGYSEAAARAPWVRSQLQRPLLEGPDALLTIDQEDWEAAIAATFNAELRRPFAGQRKHSKVSVQVNVEQGNAMLWGDAAMNPWKRWVEMAFLAPGC
jgi:hypothetical protein